MFSQRINKIIRSTRILTIDYISDSSSSDSSDSDDSVSDNNEESTSSGTSDSDNAESDQESVVFDDIFVPNRRLDNEADQSKALCHIVLALLVAAAAADKLQSNYLPPLTARTAGGSGSFLSAPRPISGLSGSSLASSGIATSYAAPPSGPAPSGLYGAPATYSTGIPVAILRYNNENNGDGTYRFEYQTENKISQQEQGHVENAGTGQESSVVHGSYTYEAPDGQMITVQYVADENGFRATGDHIPTPPPIPEAIQRSLEVNAAAERTSGYSYSSTASGSAGGSYQQPQVTRQYLAPATQTAGYRY